MGVVVSIGADPVGTTVVVGTTVSVGPVVSVGINVAVTVIVAVIGIVATGVVDIGVVVVGGMVLVGWAVLLMTAVAVAGVTWIMVPVTIGPMPTSVASATDWTMGEAITAAGASADGWVVAAVMALTVAATAASTVAAMSVGEVAGAAGSWVQLVKRMRTRARVCVNRGRIGTESFLLTCYRQRAAPSIVHQRVHG